MEKLGVGIIGMGFMGRTHLAAYERAAGDGHPCEVVAVCDADADRRAGRAGEGGNFDTHGKPLFDASRVRGYAEVEALFADERVHAVSICTPTDTHVDLALRALAAGKHVLVEKPVATSSDDVARLAAAASKAKTVCMPAMCIRFWPGWSWVCDRVRDGRYGAVRSAVFQRLASPPTWSVEFYRDVKRTGAALFDLHIHDADFLRGCFGEPQSVMSAGSIHHVTTLYRFPGGPPHVTAQGAWDHSEGFPFRMRFIVAFERATAEFDNGREPAFSVYGTADDADIRTAREQIAAGLTGYDFEVRHFLDLVSGKTTEPKVTIADALAVTRMLEAERRSFEAGAAVSIDG